MEDAHQTGWRFISALRFQANETNPFYVTASNQKYFLPGVILMVSDRSTIMFTAIVKLQPF